MRLDRLKRDRVRYRACHCAARFAAHVYRAGKLLWVCPGCDATHEAHQCDGQWDDGNPPHKMGQPLGVPASPACKTMRLLVHERLDALRRMR
eukprot:gene9186-50928_t